MRESFERIRKMTSRVRTGIVSPSVRTGIMAAAASGILIGVEAGKTIEKNKPTHTIIVEDTGERLPDSIATLSSVIEEIYAEYAVVYDRIVEATNKGNEPKAEDIAKSNELLKRAQDLENARGLLQQFQILKDSNPLEKTPTEAQPEEKIPEPDQAQPEEPNEAPVNTNTRQA
ncbi:hypothetical protein A2818_00760 [Candidatus Nomurabacteria bacterium RIFCSPHIGHO2_01_FULL_40_12]|uniref:Uncharacterized protein n=1 Tax=Candidatus Nomurabacteria bacterium RIFCSPHIGHO2_01_FULL_40_12 TaxID=1801737 RepID=A0A1F6V1D4_9BACT|nr:MAG: hypothetical protein A2818_00760 [Candidatus Nomurabacteria bacterium RIFCSPHIGHO2_01_FULL_40_12]